MNTLSRPPARPRSRHRLGPSTWIIGGLLAFLLILGFAMGTPWPPIVIVAVVGVATGLYGLITGRRSWAHLRGRKLSAIATAASVGLFVVAGSFTAAAAEPSLRDGPAAATVAPAATPTPHRSTPSADAAPVDPESTPAAASPAAVAIHDASATQGITAAALLETLPVKGRAPRTGYDREGMYGTAWIDVDRNGCDTRNDILARDLTDISRPARCKVLSGTLHDPYTGTTIGFVRGNTTSLDVQIDHVVALMDSWQTGAQQLTQAQRVALANDPLNLLAVAGSANTQKSASDAASWLPAQKSFRCEYVARQVSVKATYGLWVTSAEHDAIARVLSTCPTQPAYTSTFAPAAAAAAPAPDAPAAAPAPAPPAAPVAPAPAPPPAAPVAPAAPAPASFYANCDAVRAAGAAPIHLGDPGYSRKLDRDGDGIGCE